MNASISVMRLSRMATAGCALAAILSVPAFGNESLGKMSQDPNQWVMPGGDYSVSRFSKLEQINVSNAKDLKVAWTMSTGTLRGQEGQPLVVGDML
jgi:glucose dehydrogenase